jgi:hypothetical protein
MVIAPSEAVSVSRHFHRVIVSLFLCGYAIHALVQVDAIARAKNAKRWPIIAENWIRILARGFVSLMLFSGLWYNPSVIAAGIKAIGIPAGSTVSAILTVPIVPWTAGLFGFCIDSVLSFIPWLKNVLPPQVEANAPVAAPLPAEGK